MEKPDDLEYLFCPEYAAERRRAATDLARRFYDAYERLAQIRLRDATGNPNIQPGISERAADDRRVSGDSFSERCGGGEEPNSNLE